MEINELMVLTDVRCKWFAPYDMSRKSGRETCQRIFLDMFDLYMRGTQKNAKYWREFTDHSGGRWRWFDNQNTENDFQNQFLEQYSGTGIPLRVPVLCFSSTASVSFAAAECPVEIGDTFAFNPLPAALTGPSAFDLTAPWVYQLQKPVFSGRILLGLYGEVTGGMFIVMPRLYSRENPVAECGSVYAISK